MAGEFMDMQSGFSFAAMLDPSMGTTAAVLARFQNIFAVLLFFVTNSHYILLRGMADSFQIAPIGQLTLNASIANGIVSLFVAMFMIAIKISMPVVAAVLLADIALAIASKVVPQMNVLIVGLTLKLGIGLFTLVVALPIIMSGSKGLFGDMYGYIVNLTKLFTT
jgi:flagellar biosynthetic protein FliR